MKSVHKIHTSLEGLHVLFEEFYFLCLSLELALLIKVLAEEFIHLRRELFYCIHEECRDIGILH